MVVGSTPEGSGDLPEKDCSKGFGSLSSCRLLENDGRGGGRVAGVGAAAAGAGAAAVVVVVVVEGAESVVVVLKVVRSTEGPKAGVEEDVARSSLAAVVAGAADGLVAAPAAEEAR